MTQRDDRLARFPEPHVVGEDRTPAAQEKRDAFNLMREQALGQLRRLTERAIGLARRQRQQLREGVSLSVQGLVHL